jgi:hypothetical protein
MQGLKTYKRIRCRKKEGISAFVHNCRRNIKNVVVIRRPLTADSLKSVLRPDLDPGFLPNPDPDCCVLLIGLVCFGDKSLQLQGRVS